MTSPILRGSREVGNVVNISIQQRWASENKHPRKPLQNHHYADLWAKRPKEMVSRMHIKDNKNGKQVNFSFSKIWWSSKVSPLAIENDCVACSYRFSVPLTCTRAIIRQKVYCQSARAPDSALAESGIGVVPTVEISRHPSLDPRPWRGLWVVCRAGLT